MVACCILDSPGTRARNSVNWDQQFCLLCLWTLYHTGFGLSRLQFSQSRRVSKQGFSGKDISTADHKIEQIPAFCTRVEGSCLGRTTSRPSVLSVRSHDGDLSRLTVELSNRGTILFWQDVNLSKEVRIEARAKRLMALAAKGMQPSFGVTGAHRPWAPEFRKK